MECDHRCGNNWIILSLTSDDFCCVCWDEFEIGQKLAKLKCGHILHKQCDRVD